jgi:hypothetical protein
MKNWIQQLFNKKQPVKVNEVLKRSSQYQDKYDKWANDFIHQSKWRDYYIAIKNGVEQPSNAGNVLYSTYNGSHALALFDPHKESAEYWKYRLDWLKRQAQAIGYRIQNENRYIEEVHNEVVTREMYYLKPPIAFEPPIDQLWGNLRLELKVKGLEVDYLKIQTTFYTDYNYKKPGEFTELIDRLFEN